MRFIVGYAYAAARWVAGLALIASSGAHVAYTLANAADLIIRQGFGVSALLYGFGVSPIGLAGVLVALVICVAVVRLWRRDPRIAILLIFLSAGLLAVAS